MARDRLRLPSLCGLLRRQELQVDRAVSIGVFPDQDVSRKPVITGVGYGFPGRGDTDQVVVRRDEIVQPLISPLSRYTRGDKRTYEARLASPPHRVVAVYRAPDQESRDSKIRE